jgi:hypothetical protein
MPEMPMIEVIATFTGSGDTPSAHVIRSLNNATVTIAPPPESHSTDASRLDRRLRCIPRSNGFSIADFVIRNFELPILIHRMFLHQS